MVTLAYDYMNEVLTPIDYLTEPSNAFRETQHCLDVSSKRDTLCNYVYEIAKKTVMRGYVIAKVLQSSKRMDSVKGGY
jgi:hypothetical protein